jgi:hypothetical protein
MLEKISKKKFASLKSAFYKSSPFPHLVIDNFLPEKEFKRAIGQLKKFNSRPDLSFEDSTTSKKKVFSMHDEINEVANIVKILSSQEMISDLEKLTGASGIIPLSNFKVDQTGFRFLHQMHPGGFLGAHVDHIRIDDKIHFLNSIFYLTEDSSLNNGGLTCLYDKTGFKKLVEIEPKPNRLLVFFHSSESFHSVSNLNNNSPLRNTIYMDYYINKEQITRLRTDETIDFSPNFWEHRTTFIPRKFSDFWTLKTYMKYLLKRFFRKI